MADHVSNVLYLADHVRCIIHVMIHVILSACNTNAWLCVPHHLNRLLLLLCCWTSGMKPPTLARMYASTLRAMNDHVAIYVSTFLLVYD